MYYIFYWFICHLEIEVLFFMKKTNFNQLNLEQRQTIQYMIDKGHNFTEIANAISKDRNR